MTIDREQLLNIDYLRSFNAVPAYFGLGFIQLKIAENSRVHFYHDELPVLAEDPHNHRYNFTSYILQGALQQHIFNWDTTALNRPFMLSDEDCKGGDTKQTMQLGNLTDNSVFWLPTGSQYTMVKDTLHTVKGYDNLITYLEREVPSKETAQVAHIIGSTLVCPFSNPIPSDECWDMIADMLPSTEKKKKKKKKSGYHLADIPKGIIGEPSKLVEEAMEIADAHEQGVKIMAAVEMGDLYGALDRYREKYHPELTMDDIRAMYMVTRRAFDNGRRS